MYDHQFLSLQTQIDPLIQRAIAQAVFPAAQIEIWAHGEVVLAQNYGYLEPDTAQHPTNAKTLFDLASVSKLFTAIAMMQLVEAGAVTLDQPACTVLPEFVGPRPILPYPALRSCSKAQMQAALAAGQPYVEAEQVTFRHMMAHHAGLPPGLPLYEWGEHWREGLLATPFAYPVGARVWYSDVGFMLIGLTIERLTGLPLREVICQRVIAPLALQHTHYGPISHPNVAPTEFYPQWGKRMRGEVHDENTLAVGGVAGHAGLFATARDVAIFGQALLNGGGPLLQPHTLGEMRRKQAENTLSAAATLQGGSAMVRGLGFQLWSPDPISPTYPFSPAVFGHTGFTGTSLFVDPARSLVVVFLSNRVYAGRHTYEAARDVRNDIHRIIAAHFSEIS
ncbi:MAG: beta-lactamase family protein [Anaerolineae bacterium]|nr:beta-lactamase family protein [Anaerolineae bacterium]